MVQCVRVPRSRGEEVRQALMEEGILNTDYQIQSTDGHVLIPVTQEPSTIEDVALVERQLTETNARPSLDDLLETHPTYEQVGDIIILQEPAEDAQEIADAIMRSSLNAKTVVNVQSAVQGDERTRSLSVLAGNGTETVYKEYGYEYELDVRDVYFTPRLSAERQRVLSTITAGETVIDMFAGVGPYVIPAAASGATAVGIDINKDAISYLRNNAIRNGVAERVTAHHGDVRDIAPMYNGRADHIIMNLPHTADEFADTAVALAGKEAKIHYYDFQPEEEPFANGKEAFERATDGTQYSATVIQSRVVRPYAPGIVNSYCCIQLS